MITILPSETHVNIAVVNSAGDIIAWQAQPYFTLADLYPAKVKWLSNRTSLARPGSEDEVARRGQTERNIRVFTGCVYLKLSEDDEQRIKDGNTSLIDSLLHVHFTDGSEEAYILNSLWSSATKNRTLTGYTADLNAALRHVFNYAESGVRTGRATRGGYANGKVKDWPVQFLPMGELLDTGHGFPLVVGDGETFIRASDAAPLRRAMSFMGEWMQPFTLGQWRLSAQVTSQIKHPLDQESAVLELLPHVVEGLGRVNNHAEFIAHAFRFDITPESEAKLFDLSETMYDHPDLNLALSPDKARAIFDVIATGKPKSIQGFIAMAGTLDGTAVFPSGQSRFAHTPMGGPGASEQSSQGGYGSLYLLVRYPVNNSRCIMPVVAVQSGPQADFLNEVEQFQGTLFGTDGQNKFMSVGQFIVIPDEYWPEAYAEARLIGCSENVKACSTWKSAEDVKASKARKELTRFTGYISVNQWAHKGNAVMIDPAVWKEANGDFDYDQGAAMPETEFPLIFDAFRKEWEVTEGLAISKLPKIYTFDDPKASRARTLTDTLAGAMAVGLAANCNLVILNNDPTKWNDVATRIDSDAYFYGQMVAKGYIQESYTEELVAWFQEICECNEDDARRVIRMFYVLSFFIQCGVDGFKTNLDTIGGMTALVKEIGRVWKVLTQELLLSQRLIAFNPKKSSTALRDRDHLPQYEEDEQVFGVSETLMKMAVQGFTWDGWPHQLELPDYLYLGALPDSFKSYAIGPRSLEELEAARLLRRICRDELGRRSMMTPQDWALFTEKFWRPLVQDFHANARIILRYERTVVEGKPTYRIARQRTFPSLKGISWERIAHLLWFTFHDTGGKSTGSVIPLFWIEEIRDHLFDLIQRQPGRAEFQDEFDQVVVGLDKAGIERDVLYEVDVHIERVKEVIVVGRDTETGEDITLTAERSRNVIEFGDGCYVMFPKDGPLLGGARFSVTFRREGSRDVGHFVRASLWSPVSTADLAERLGALKAEFSR